MESFVQSISSLAGGMVVNGTGLEGYYALRLDFDPDVLESSRDRPSADAPPDVFTAVREQLGLRLEARKISAPVLVIDRLERPTPN